MLSPLALRIRRALFDHRVGTGEQSLRKRKAERLRGLGIDHQLGAGRLRPVRGGGRAWKKSRSAGNKA